MTNTVARSVACVVNESVLGHIIAIAPRVALKSFDVCGYTVPKVCCRMLQTALLLFCEHGYQARLHMAACVCAMVHLKTSDLSRTFRSCILVSHGSLVLLAMVNLLDCSAQAKQKLSM